MFCGGLILTYNSFMRLEDIHYCPRCAAPVTHALRYGRERPVCPVCDWIYFDDPKVAAGVLVEQNGRILLVCRANPPQQGLWTVPAGFVNGGEDPAEAAARECEEETGLRVKITGLLDIVPGREHPRGADFVIFYRGQVTGGVICAGDDADAADWFEKTSLPPLAFRATQVVLARLNGYGLPPG